jgi:hypothetical protein
MSKLYNGSICVSDLPKDKLTKAKNGKLYLNINLWLNDAPDQYGNIGSVQVATTKEEREKGNKGAYIGNFKESQVPTPQAPAQNEIDDLPW